MKITDDNCFKFAEKMGVKDGKRQSPKTESDSLSLNEILLQNFFQHKLSAKVQEQNQKFGDYKTHIEQIKTQSETYVKAIEQKLQEMSDFTVEKFMDASKQNLIGERYREYMDSESKKKVFKRQHNINRDADYPVNKWASVALLIGAVIIEAFVGAALLHNNQNAEVGYLTAFLISISMSLAAVIILAICGYQCTYFNYVSEDGNSKRTKAIVCSIVAAAIFYLFLTMLIELRSSLTDFNFWRALKFGSFGASGKNEALAEFGMLSLMVIVLIGGLAKGYFWSDKYPGYEEIDRAALKSKVGFEGLIKKIRDDFENNYLTIKSDLEKNQKEMNGLLQGYAKNFSELKKINNDLEIFKKIVNECNQCLQIYRQSNLDVRTARKPNYFNEPVFLDLNSIQELTEKISLIGESESQGKEFIKENLDKFDTKYKECFNQLLKKKAGISQAIEGSIEKAWQSAERDPES